VKGRGQREGEGEISRARQDLGVTSGGKRKVRTTEGEQEESGRWQRR